jgi:hypothetical protein
VDASIDSQDIVQLSRCIVQVRVPLLPQLYGSPMQRLRRGRVLCCTALLGSTDPTENLWDPFLTPVRAGAALQVGGRIIDVDTRGGGGGGGNGRIIDVEAKWL